jgi:hypothetical protein
MQNEQQRHNARLALNKVNGAQKVSFRTAKQISCRSLWLYFVFRSLRSGQAFVPLW